MGTELKGKKLQKNQCTAQIKYQWLLQEWENGLCFCLLNLNLHSVQPYSFFDIKSTNGTITIVILQKLLKFQEKKICKKN